MTSGHDRERAAKQRIAALLRSAEHLLAPGTWRITDVRSASVRPSGFEVIADLVKRAVRTRPLKKSAIELRRALTAPRSVVLTGSGEITRVLATKEGGLVGFDSAEQTVWHVRATPFPSEYRASRAALADVYRSHDWSLSEDRRTLRETRVPGRGFEDWDPSDRLRTLRDILHQTTERLAAGGERSALVPQDSLLFSDPSLSADARWDAVRRMATQEVPWLLAHGDLTPENVIGTGPSDWAPIDWEDARVAPFFFDPLSLVIRDEALRNACLSGDVENEWKELLRSADVTELPLRAALDVVALLAAEHHSRVHGGDFAYTVQDLSGHRGPATV